MTCFHADFRFFSLVWLMVITSPCYVARPDDDILQNIADVNPFLPSQNAAKLHSRDDPIACSKMKIATTESLDWIGDDHELNPHINHEDFDFLGNRQIQDQMQSQTQPQEDKNSNAIPNIPSSSLRKTGTTIAGIRGRDFCLLAADTRATMGMTVADLRAEKLHPLVHNTRGASPRTAQTTCWAAGAGTSADLQHLTQACLYSQKLQQQYAETIGNSNYFDDEVATKSSVLSGQSICQWLRRELYKQKGSCQANLIVGGICPRLGQPFLRAIHPHGSMDELSFAALGSGGLAAMAVLESSLIHSDDLTMEQAKIILLRAIQAGISNDLGSGSQIDFVGMQRHSNGTITTTYQRAAVAEQELPTLSPSDSKGGVGLKLNGGVNGFGNTPFALKPSRAGLQAIPKAPEQVQSEWNQLLGL